MSETIKSNPEAGNIWAGWLLAELIKSWPQPHSFHSYDLIKSTEVTVSTDSPVYTAMSLVRWLIEEGYIRVQMELSDGSFRNVVLTEKALIILNSIPANMQTKRPAGEILTEKAGDIASEAGKSALGDFFGQLIGGLIKSVTTG